MTVTVLTSAAAVTSAGAGGNNTAAVNAGTGTDRVLYVLTFHSGASVSAASYAGAAMTLVASFGNARLWSKTAPASGSNTLSMTTTDGFQTQYVAVALSGVDQTTPHGSLVSSSGTSAAAASGSVTVPTDGMALAFLSLGYTNAAPTATSPSTLRGAHRDAASGLSVAGASRTTTGAVAWSHESTTWTVRALPINAVAVPGEIGGGVTLDDAAAGGSLAMSASDIGGGASLADALADGALGMQSGIVSALALRNWSGGLQTSVTIPVVTVCRLSDGAQVLTLTDQTTHASTGDLTITSASLIVGTWYMVMGWNADGSARFAVPLQATA